MSQPYVTTRTSATRALRESNPEGEAQGNGESSQTISGALQDPQRGLPSDNDNVEANIAAR